MWLLASNASWGIFACGVLLLIFVLMKRSRRYTRRARRDARTEHNRLVEPDRDKALIDAPREILRWQVGMHETARDLKAELDSKIGVLQATIRIANEETERLEAAINRAERLGVSACGDTLAEIERIADASVLTTGDLPDPGTSEFATISPLESHRSRIFALADEGCGAQAIAASTGLPCGDVELVLSLRAPQN
ncbi:MAG: hypothetical protein CMJ64_24460 [Planctomycetaceae bacterium]|nr:hypothetical protein [Planctomycetaceae bacterium]